MTRATWRNGLHKFIVITGFMALIAIISGATTNPYTHLRSQSAWVNK